MADQLLLALLKKRVKTWNHWQRQHANIRPDLRNADLERAQLSFAQLQRADLHEANFCHALLCDANLRWVDLSGADIRFANLSRANLSHANLSGANLSHANLHAANLNGAIFSETLLTNTNLSQTLLRSTIFANVDLSSVRGLDTVYHLRPSTMGVDTLSRSKKNLSDAFLRDVQVHEHLITSIREQGTAPFEYFSVFISYASEDLMFVQNLRDALQREGVWCWFAPDALRGGDFFKARIDNAIRQCDKLLVIFSRSALASPWVKYEVELARQKERKQKTAVIIPLSLDATLFKEPSWATFLREKRHIREFEQWKHTPSYQKALQLLLHDLQMPS